MTAKRWNVEENWEEFSFLQLTWALALHCQGALCYLSVPQSAAPRAGREQLCSQLDSVPNSNSSLWPNMRLELFHSHPAWEALGRWALQLHSLFQGTLSWSLESQFYFSICMKFFPVRSKPVIVSACTGTIPGLFLLSILDLAFISQHCHNWCTWLEAEKSIVCFPSPQCLKGLGTECPPPAETHSTHQHHFMGLYLPLSAHESACQVLLLGWGWNSPRGWPCFPWGRAQPGTAVSDGRKLGIHSPHRRHPCLAAPTNTENSWGH